MDFKAASCATVCLTALSLCLMGGCDSTPTAPPRPPGTAPGYFGADGKGPGQASATGKSVEELKAGFKSKKGVPAK